MMNRAFGLRREAPRQPTLPGYSGDYRTLPVIRTPIAQIQGGNLTHPRFDSWFWHPLPSIPMLGIKKRIKSLILPRIARNAFRVPRRERPGRHDFF